MVRMYICTYACYFNCLCNYVRMCTRHVGPTVLANVAINDDQVKIILSWKVCCTYSMFEDNTIIHTYVHT